MLERIDGIDAQGIAAIDVSPVYWRTLGNRLAARLPLPEYTAERHAAGGEGAAMTTIHHRAHARSRAASSLAPARSRIVVAGFARRRPRYAGLCRIRAPAAAPDLQPIRQRGGRLVSRAAARPSAALPRPLSVGSIVLTRLPAEAGVLAAQRGYLPAHIPLLKRVGAVAPQHVCIVAGQVRIDGVPVTAALPADRLGRPLPSWQHCRHWPRASCSC